jgi:RNA polymerase sigma-70 factor (ECF subfamily)
MANEPSDSDLVRLSRAGDAAAFSALAGRHMREVYALARSFALNHADADDLSQEAFLHAFRALRTFDGRSSFRTWLLRITVNACTNFVNRRPPSAAGTGDLASVADCAAGPAEVMSAQELDGALWAAVAGLPADLRTTLHLVVVEGLTHREAAEALGCPRNTVSWRMFRARELLRKQLVPLLGDGKGNGQ